MGESAAERRENYREVYLRSEHWLRTRAVALQQAEYRCQVCNSTKSLDVHHRTYERLGAETLADLTVLCRRCHELFHGSRRKLQTTKKRKSKAKVVSIHDPLAGASGPDPSLTLNLLLPVQRAILNLLADRGPMNTRAIAPIIGLTVAKTGAQLHKLRTGKYILRRGKFWIITSKGRKSK